MGSLYLQTNACAAGLLHMLVNALSLAVHIMHALGKHTLPNGAVPLTCLRICMPVPVRLASSNFYGQELEV